MVTNAGRRPGPTQGEGQEEHRNATGAERIRAGPRKRVHAKDIDEGGHVLQAPRRSTQQDGAPNHV